MTFLNSNQQATPPKNPINNNQEGQNELSGAKN